MKKQRSTNTTNGFAKKLGRDQWKSVLEFLPTGFWGRVFAHTCSEFASVVRQCPPTSPFFQRQLAAQTAGWQERIEALFFHPNRPVHQSFLKGYLRGIRNPDGRIDPYFAPNGKHVFLSATQVHLDVSIRHIITVHRRTGSAKTGYDDVCARCEHWCHNRRRLRGSHFVFHIDNLPLHDVSYMYTCYRECMKNLEFECAICDECLHEAVRGDTQHHDIKGKKCYLIQPDRLPGLRPSLLP